MAGRKIDYLLPLLVGGFGVNARIPAGGVRFIGQARPLLDGTGKQVSDFTDAGILTHVRAHWTGSGKGGTRVFVAHGGGVQSAEAVLREAEIKDPLEFVASNVGVLLAESRRLDPDDPLRALLGEDWLGSTSPIMLSEDERTLRLLEAVVTATGQVAANGLDPRILFGGTLLPATLRFVRSHIVRNGMEQGVAGELVDAAATSLLPLKVPVIYQLPLPRVKKPHSLTNGFDGLMDTTQLLVPKQVKAVSLARAALIGRVVPHWIGTTLDSVHGPDALAQVVSDRFRSSIWEHLVPGRGVDPPYPSSLPAITTGWRRVSPVTVVTIQSQFLMDTAVGAIGAHMWNSRTATLNIGRDFDMPGAVKTQIRAIVGGPTISRDTPIATLREQTRVWIDGQVPIWEEGMNTRLDSATVREIVRMDSTPEVRLAATHQQQRLLDIYAELDLLRSGTP